MPYHCCSMAETQRTVSLEQEVSYWPNEGILIREEKNYSVRRFNYASEDVKGLYLLRYLPKKKAVREPVVGLHGIAQRAESLDFLASYLANHGIEFFSLELRGREGPQNDGWHLGHYWHYDLPKGISVAKKISKEQKIFGLGFSLGNFLMCRYYLGHQSSREELQGIILLSFPYDMVKTHPFLKFLANYVYYPLEGIAKIKYSGLKVPTSVAAGIYSFVAIPTEFTDLILRVLGIKLPMLYNPDNITPNEIRREFTRNIVDIPLMEFRPLVLAMDDRFQKDHEKARLTSWAEAPVIMLAGTEDQVAPPESMEMHFDKIPSGEKKFVVIENAGHLDIGYDNRTADKINRFVKKYGTRILV